MSGCKAIGCDRYHLHGSKYCKQHYEEMMAKWDVEKLMQQEAKVVDNVNHPSHYGQGKIEAIEYISDFLTPEEYQGYLRGNIAKYLHRWPYKNQVEDLRKAAWYLDKLIKEIEE
jgi:hypothetical protein